MMGGRRKLHGREFHKLYTYSGIIRAIRSRRMIWEGHVALTEDMKNTYRILDTELERKNDRRRWEDNIKMERYKLHSLVHDKGQQWDSINMAKNRRVLQNMENFPTR